MFVHFMAALIFAGFAGLPGIDSGETDSGETPSRHAAARQQTSTTGLDGSQTTDSPDESSAQPRQQQASDLPSTTVVATVDGSEITAGEVRHFLDQRFKLLNRADRTAAIARPEIRAAALQQLVDRRIVFENIKTKSMAIPMGTVEAKLIEFQESLKVEGKTLDQWLEQQMISLDQFKFEIQWRISWQAFLDASLTDQYLSDYYQRNRRRFDGTELRVAHILIQNPDDEAKQTLESVRQQLEEGFTSWQQAVETHSTAPSKSEGGELGWIRIDGPMEPVFTTAAFELETGRMSPVIESPFGIHIIKCLEVRPGKNDPGDVLDSIKEDATSNGFREIVRATRNQRTVVYFDNWPRLDESGTIIGAEPGADQR